MPFRYPFSKKYTSFRSKSKWKFCCKNIKLPFIFDIAKVGM